MDKRKGNTDLTEGKVWKVIVRFAVPLLVGNLLQQFYNITDSIIVGQFLGKDVYKRQIGLSTVMCLKFSSQHHLSLYILVFPV